MCYDVCWLNYDTGENGMSGEDGPAVNTQDKEGMTMSMF